MTAALLAGAVAGYAIAIPVGAIAVLIVDVGLRRGFRPAFAAGAGAATADGLYAALAMIAGAAVAASLVPIQAPLRVVAAVVLLAIAARGFVGLVRTRTRPPDAGRPSSAGAIYLRFTGLTLLNPQTVIYFAALILGLPSLVGGAGERLAFVAGAFLASLSWQTILAVIGATAHRRLPGAFRSVLSVVGNLVIAGFAVAILASAA